MRVALIVAGVAVLVAGLAWLDGGAQVVEPARIAPTRTAKPVDADAPDAQDLVLQRRVVGDGSIPFRHETWTPAPPPPPARAEPSAPLAPTAPPLPFRVAGSMEQDGKTVYLLSGPGGSYVVGAGEDVDANYKLVAVKDTHLEFLYLPLKEVQLLPLPAGG